jgi:hypothetical protein
VVYFVKPMVYNYAHNTIKLKAQHDTDECKYTRICCYINYDNS